MQPLSGCPCVAGHGSPSAVPTYTSRPSSFHAAPPWGTVRRRPGPRIVYVNDAICAMTGYTQEELLGTTPRILHGPRTEREVVDRLAANLDAGAPFLGQTWNYRKDGSPFVMRWRVDPVRDADGRVTA